MAFPTTVWSRILSGDHVVRRYTEPINRFLLAQRVPPEDARDLTQEVLIHVLAPGFLQRADPKLGRFRNLLLAVTVRVWKMWVRGRVAQKRGGGDRPVALDDAAVAELVDEAASRPVEDAFARAWTETVFAHAMQKLAAEHAMQHEILRLRFLEELPSAEVERRLGIDEAQVRNHAHRGKKRLEALVEDEIRAYCSSDEELADELRDLNARLG